MPEKSDLWESVTFLCSIKELDYIVVIDGVSENRISYDIFSMRGKSIYDSNLIIRAPHINIKKLTQHLTYALKF